MGLSTIEFGTDICSAALQYIDYVSAETFFIGIRWAIERSLWRRAQDFKLLNSPH